MDIRKKGAVGVLVFNILMLIAIYSIVISTNGQLTITVHYSNGPDNAYHFNPIVSLFIIIIFQFIIFSVMAYILDLKLRNYSPAYIEKKREKYISKKQREFEGAATAEQITIYLKYKRNINDFTQTATPEEKAALSIEQWYTIDNLAGDILLIKKGQVAQSTINSVGKRIKDKLKDQAAMDLLLTIE